MNAREETTQAARSVVSMEDGNKHKIDLIDSGWMRLPLQQHRQQEQKISLLCAENVRLVTHI